MLETWIFGNVNYGEGGILVLRSKQINHKIARPNQLACRLLPGAAAAPPFNHIDFFVI